MKNDIIGDNAFNSIPPLPNKQLVAPKKKMPNLFEDDDDED